MGVDKIRRPRVSNSFMPAPGGFHITDTFKEAVIPLTSAQLIAMHTTPVAILPAPSTGKAIIPVYLLFDMLAGSVAFTGGGVVSFQYHTATSVAPFNTTVAASVVTNATPGTYLAYLDPSGTFATPLADGIDITNASAVFAAGNGSAKVIIGYRVITA